MKLKKMWMGYDVLKSALIGLLCLWAAWIVGSALWEVKTADRLMAELSSLENADYLDTINQLKEQKMLSEALELARFVSERPDMPHYAECQELSKALDKELNSVAARAARVNRGFWTGNGDTVEEIGGSICSDMIIYGDLRDLAKQGWFKATNNEEKQDPVIAALAGVGLLTEAYDYIDWGPAVLKAFRKVKALTDKFSDVLVKLCKKSMKAKKMDGSLKQVFLNIKALTDKVGLGRAAGMIKQVDSSADLATLAKAVDKTPNAYIFVKAGGKDSVELLKPLVGTAIAPELITVAAKKGKSGVKWMKESKKGNKALRSLRFASRAGKHIRKGHHKRVLSDAFESFSWAEDIGRITFWGLLVTGILKWIDALRKAGPFLKAKKAV